MIRYPVTQQDKETAMQLDIDRLICRFQAVPWLTHSPRLSAEPVSRAAI